MHKRCRYRSCINWLILINPFPKSRLFLKIINSLSSTVEHISSNWNQQAAFFCIERRNFLVLFIRVDIPKVRNEIHQIFLIKFVVLFLKIIEDLSIFESNNVGEFLSRFFINLNWILYFESQLSCKLKDHFHKKLAFKPLSSSQYLFVASSQSQLIW